jgi:hypothetical protein
MSMGGALGDFAANTGLNCCPADVSLKVQANTGMIDLNTEGLDKSMTGNWYSHIGHNFSFCEKVTVSD